MRWSLAISLVVHACILLVAVGVFQSPDEYKVEELESVPVELVSLDEFSKRQAVQKDVPKPEPEQKIAPKVKVVPEIKEIAPKPAEEIKQAAREPQPEPEPKPAKEPEPVAEPEPQPEPLEEPIKETEQIEPEPVAEPEPEPVKKAAVPLPRAKPKKLVRKIAEKKKKKKKKKPAFNPDDVAALLNKIDDEKAAPPIDGDPDSTPEQDELTSLIGHDDSISASELDWFRQKVGQCWNVPAGARDAQNLIVKIRIKMDPLGNVMGQPRIENTSNHPVFEAASRSAIAAVVGCQPYEMFSAEKYNSWKEILINFDPSLMLAIN